MAPRPQDTQVEHDGGRELAPHNASDVVPAKVKPFGPNHACTSIIHFPSIVLAQLLEMLRSDPHPSYFNKANTQ